MKYAITFLVVEKLNEKQPDRIRFYLSKADTAGHESDRQVGILKARFPRGEFIPATRSEK